jgi:hypothetical protein
MRAHTYYEIMVSHIGKEIRKELNNYKQEKNQNEIILKNKIINIKDSLIAKLYMKEYSLYTINLSYMTLYIPFLIYFLHANPNSKLRLEYKTKKYLLLGIYLVLTIIEIW